MTKDNEENKLFIVSYVVSTPRVGKKTKSLKIHRQVRKRKGKVQGVERGRDKCQVMTKMLIMRVRIIW